MNRFVKMDDKDMVATALVDLSKDDIAHIFTPDNKLIGELKALENIPYGNKIALCPISAGTGVIKYGATIGECTHDIAGGELVHVHNVKSLVVDIPPAFKKEIMRQMTIETKEG